MSADSEGPKTPSGTQSLDFSSSPDAVIIPSPSICSPATSDPASSEDSPQTPGTPVIPSPLTDDTQDSGAFEYPLPSAQTIPSVASIGNDSTLRSIWDFYELHQTLENSLDEDLQHEPLTPEHFDQSTVLHTFFIIKKVSTIQCDSCDMKGKGEEVYKCAQCVKQICRQCMHDGFDHEAKELAKFDQPTEEDKELSKWTWDGDYRHEGFKQCFLAREAAKSKGNFQVGVPLSLLGMPSQGVVTVYMVHDNSNGNDDAPNNKRPRHGPDSDSDESPDLTPTKPPAKHVRRNTANPTTKVKVGATSQDTNQRTRDGLSTDVSKKLDRIGRAAAAANQPQARSSSTHGVSVPATSNQHGTIPARSQPALPQQPTYSQQAAQAQQPSYSQQPHQPAQRQSSDQDSGAFVHPGYHQQPAPGPWIPFDQHPGLFPPPYATPRQVEYAAQNQQMHMQSLRSGIFQRPTFGGIFQQPTYGIHQGRGDLYGGNIPQSAYGQQYDPQYSHMQQHAPAQQHVHNQQHAQNQQATFARQPGPTQQRPQAQPRRRSSAQISIFAQHQAQPAVHTSSTTRSGTQSNNQLHLARRPSDSQQSGRGIRFSPPPGTVLVFPNGSLGDIKFLTWAKYQQHQASLAGPSPPSTPTSAPTAAQVTQLSRPFLSNLPTADPPAGHGSSRSQAQAPQQNPAIFRQNQAAPITLFPLNMAGLSRFQVTRRIQGRRVGMLPSSESVRPEYMPIQRPGPIVTLVRGRPYTSALDAANQLWRQNRERGRINQPFQVVVDVGGRRGGRNDDDDDNMPDAPQPSQQQDGKSGQGAQQPPQKQDDLPGESSADANDDQPMPEADDQPAEDDSKQQGGAEATLFGNTADIAEPQRPSSAPSLSTFPPLLELDDTQPSARAGSASLHINDVWQRMFANGNDVDSDNADDIDADDAGADDIDAEDTDADDAGADDVGAEDAGEDDTDVDDAGADDAGADDAGADDATEEDPNLQDAPVNNDNNNKNNRVNNNTNRTHRYALRAEDQIRGIHRDDYIRARLRAALAQWPDAVAMGYASGPLFVRDRAEYEASLRRAAGSTVTRKAAAAAAAADADADAMDVDDRSSETLAAAPYDDEDDEDFPAPRSRPSKRKGKGKYASKRTTRKRKKAPSASTNIKTKREDSDAEDEEEGGNDDAAAAAATIEPEVEEEDDDDVDMNDADAGGEGADADAGAGAGAGARAATGTDPPDRRTRSGRGYGV